MGEKSCVPFSFSLNVFNDAATHGASVAAAAQSLATSQLGVLSAFFQSHGIAASDDPTGDILNNAVEWSQYEASQWTTAQTFLNSTTPLEIANINADFDAESAFATTAIGEIYAANTAIIAAMADYERAVNALDRDWIDTATAQDGNLISAFADGLLDANSPGYPDGDPLGPYATQLSASSADWPLSLGEMSPAYLALHPEHENLAKPILQSGTIDISAVLQAFAPIDPPEAIQLDVEEETAPEPTLTTSTDDLAIKPASVEVDWDFAYGEHVEIGGMSVGWVDQDASGNLVVRRHGVQAGVMPSVPGDGSSGSGLCPEVEYQGETYYPEGCGTFTFTMPLAAVEAQLTAIAETGSLAGYTSWDQFFSFGTSQEFTYAQAMGNNPATAPPQPYTSVFDALPRSVVRMIGGQRGDGLDQVVRAVDATAAGMSSTVTGGLTDSVRNAIYGDIAAEAEDSAFYTAGQIAGIVPAIAVGALGGATAAHTGNLIRVSRTIASASTVFEFSTAAHAAANGDFSAGTLLGLVPGVTAGTSRMFKWVQCFEGDTPVVVDWVDVRHVEVATSGASSSDDWALSKMFASSKFWLVAGACVAVGWWLAEQKLRERERTTRVPVVFGWHDELGPIHVFAS